LVPIAPGTEPFGDLRVHGLDQPPVVLLDHPGGLDNLVGACAHCNELRGGTEGRQAALAKQRRSERYIARKEGD
jgi:hypothetical protein